MHEPSSSHPEAKWEALVGALVSRRLVVFILTALLVGAGLAYAPFSWGPAWLPRDPVAVDALPDISDNQQVVFTQWPGRSPRDVEDQVTYPLTTALLGLPGVRSVRSSSAFGFSSIYVIFEDEVEFYWSRSRVLEKLASLPPNTLPSDVTPTLGPDATALGQVFWYTLEVTDAQGQPVAGAFSLHELRSVQDWTVRYALQSVAGVSEVASVGGFVREYQVDVDPQAMLAAGVDIGQVARAVTGANLDTGARTVEINRAEYVIRGVGQVQDVEDLEQVVIAARDHTPIRVRDVARVGLGPALRRGVLDDAGAEVVGGVVVVRFGDNPLRVIEGVRAKIAEISPGLPRREVDGRTAQVRIVPFYDRTVLIEQTLGTLSDALVQQILITMLVILLVMRHLPSSVLVSVLLPMGVLATFVLMKAFGVDANVMALAGIAIAIGTMVDMGIVFVENMVRHLQQAPPGSSTAACVRRAAGEVAGPVMTSVLTTILGFIPVFGLSGAEAKLFVPLAFTKTFALLAAMALAVLVLPALGMLLLRGPRATARSRGAWRGLYREATFGWIVVVAGLVSLRFGAGGVGTVAIAVGVAHVAATVLPAGPRRWLELGADLVTAVAVAGLLTTSWMPLGLDHSWAANFVLVAVMLGLSLGAFGSFAWGYVPLLRLALRHKIVFLGANLVFVLLGIAAWRGGATFVDPLPEPLRRTTMATAVTDGMPGLASDFMPAFDEGAFLFMPSTTPHASLGQAHELLRHIDAAIAQIPEVDRVVGKLGRVDSPLDPAPVSMFETVVGYVPQYRHDETGAIGRYAFDEAAGEHLRDEAGQLVPDEDGRPFRQWRDHIRSPDDIWDEITAAARHPGLTGAPKLMPIETRIVMLQSGMRSSVGIKVRGPDLPSIERFGLAIEAHLRQAALPQIDVSTVLADRVVGKPYLEIVIDREAIARYGLTIAQVQDVIQVAVGGKVLGRSVEGRERYPIRVRYMREERDSVEALERVLVMSASGEQVLLSQLADLRYVRGPQMIRSEDTFLTSYVTFDAADEVGDVEAVQAVERLLDEALADGSLVVPDGVSYRFAGTYENQVHSEERLRVLVPLALVVIFVLLYLQFRRTTTALMVFSGMALAASGGMLLLWLYGKPWFLDAAPLGVDLRALLQVGDVKLTVAVWVGFLALFGVATDNGVIVATYLGQRFRGAAVGSVAEIHDRVVEAGQRRVRACTMTTATTLLALLPVVTSTGRGADLMIPMALPTVGGVALSRVTLLTVPVRFSAGEEVRLWWRRRGG
ncbi:MAG: efflux RND transporter permease subunit [Nannocystaceae bacterium]